MFHFTFAMRVADCVMSIPITRRDDMRLSAYDYRRKCGTPVPSAVLYGGSLNLSLHCMPCFVSQ